MPRTPRASSFSVADCVAGTAPALGRVASPSLMFDSSHSVLGPASPRHLPPAARRGENRTAVRSLLRRLRGLLKQEDSRLLNLPSRAPIARKRYAHSDMTSPSQFSASWYR